MFHLHTRHCVQALYDSCFLFFSLETTQNMATIRLSLEPCSKKQSPVYSICCHRPGGAPYFSDSSRAVATVNLTLPHG